MSGRRETQQYDGRVVRTIRQTAGVRMVTLADAVGCHYRHLAQFERDTRHISPEMAHRLANALTTLVGRPVTVDEFTVPLRSVAA
jgi:transcriptional regulator with XRE-family HTH domain